MLKPFLKNVLNYFIPVSSVGLTMSRILGASGGGVVGFMFESDTTSLEGGGS